MDRGSETSLLSQIVGNQVFHARALTESAHGNAVQSSRGTWRLGWEKGEGCLAERISFLIDIDESNF